MIISHNDELLLSIYKEYVAKLADDRSEDVFPNSSAKHAAVVLGNFFRTCNHVILYDTNIQGDIAYTDEIFMKELKSAIDRDTFVLDIFIRSEENLKSHTLFSILKDIKRTSNNSKISLFVVSKDLEREVHSCKEELGIDSLEINFATGDSRACRVEKFKEKNSFTAECSFNNPSVAKALDTTLFKYRDSLKSIL